MEKPKYAGLPGIAPPDEKDVYETDDLPEADQCPDPVIPVDSEFVKHPHLDVAKSHAVFKNKTLICGKGVDFSDRYRRERHTGYEAVSGDWEILPEGEKETIIQRYNRLQCEVKSLIEDIEKIKEKSAEEKTSEEQAAEGLVVELEKSLQQLNSCMNLTELMSSDLLQSISDPQGAQVQKLLAKLEGLKDLGEKKEKPGSKEESADGMITYQLKTFPAQNKFLQSARIASLEQRLNKLENVIGTNPESLDRLQLSEFETLSEAAHEISARINLLDENQIEKIDSKLSAVLSKMDSIAEKRGGPDLVEAKKKIDELYEFLGKSEALNQSLKPIMDRLVALKSLHFEAAEFKRTLKKLETEESNMEINLSNNSAALKKMKDDLKEALQIVTENIQALEGRVAALKK